MVNTITDKQLIRKGLFWCYEFKLNGEYACGYALTAKGAIREAYKRFGTYYAREDVAQLKERGFTNLA